MGNRGKFTVEPRRPLSFSAAPARLCGAVPMSTTTTRWCFSPAASHHGKRTGPGTGLRRGPGATVAVARSPSTIRRYECHCDIFGGDGPSLRGEIRWSFVFAVCCPRLVRNVVSSAPKVGQVFGGSGVILKSPVRSRSAPRSNVCMSRGLRSRVPRGPDCGRPGSRVGFRGARRALEVGATLGDEFGRRKASLQWSGRARSAREHGRGRLLRTRRWTRSRPMATAAQRRGNVGVVPRLVRRAFTVTGPAQTVRSPPVQLND